MATAYSGEVSIGTYNRIRIKCDYSGTSATCTVQFRRTQAYSGYWGDSRATLTFNGTTKSTPYSYSGTVGTSWINIASASGYSVSTSGGTYNWSFSNPGGGVLGCSGTLTISPSATLPSGLVIDFVSATYNSVTIDTTVGDWGSGSNPEREAFLLEVPYVAGVDKYLNYYKGGDTGIVRLTVGAQSEFEFSTPAFKIYGCHQYHTGLWANTSAGATRLQGPQFYTAPFQLGSLTYASETYTNSSVTATLTAVTDAVNNDTSNHIGFEYRVSEDGGDTFGEWIYHTTTVTAGSTASLSIPDLKMGTGYAVEVRQYCVESDLKFYSPSTACNFTTKRYRKTYGPGDGYATYVPENETDYTIDNTVDNGIKVSMLGGKTSQDSVNSSDPKNLMPLSPITGAAVSWAQQCSYEYVWDAEIKRTVLHMWCSASQQFPGIGFSIANYNIAKNKNYAVSIKYKMTSNVKNATMYGSATLNGRNSWEPLGSNTPTGIKVSNGYSDGTNKYPKYELNPIGKWTTSTVRTSKDAAEWSSYTPSQIVVQLNSDTSGWQTDIWISDIMIEEITDAQYSASAFTPVFTPYTAKQVAPTPDAPMPVKTVTGRQTFKITGANGAEQEYEINLGKNLLNIPDLDTTGYGLHFVCKDGVLSITGATGDTYYPSIRFYPDGSYVVGAWYPTASNIDASKGYFLDKWEMGTFSARVEGSSTYTINYVDETTAYNVKAGVTGSQFVTIDGKRRVNLWSICFQPNKTINLKLKLQFEKGPEATSWAPYFEPIELNHLGLYQDWIIYSGGKWLLNKATGKVDLGAQTWSSVSGIAGLRETTGIPNIQYVSSNTQLGDGIADNYTMHTGSGMSAASALNNIAIDVSQVSVNTGSDSIDPTGTFRYALVIPTFDEITNQYVLEGLEKLRKLGHTYIGATTFSLNGYGNEEFAPLMSVATNSDNLPPYYQRLQYIESDGNQYITTPVIPTTAYRVELVAAWTYGSCGGSNHPSEGRTLFDMRNIASGNVGIYAGSTARTFTGISTGKHTYYIDYYNSVMGIDNETYPLASGQIPSTKALAIGAWFEGVVYYYKATGKTYRFTVYNLGEKIYDFVPCKSLKDNKVGMYDVINHKFYPCSVSGYDYTAGPGYASLSTKQIRKLYGPKPAKKNLLDVPLNFTVTNSNHYRSIPVTLEANKTYTMSIQDIVSDGATTFLVSTWNGSTEVDSGHSFTATDKTWTFTRTGDCTNIFIYSSYNWANSGSHTTTFHGLMIEEGSEATTYQAYSNGVSAGKSKRIKKLYGPTPAQVNLIHVGPTNQIESSQTSNSLTWYRNRLAAEEVTCAGTVTSNWSNFSGQYSANWPAGTYTLSIDHPLPFSVYIRLSGGAGDKSIPVGSTSVTFTTTTTTTAYYFFASNMTYGKYYNETFKLQLVKGSTPSYDFKLYSDGTNAGKSKLIYNG